MDINNPREVLGFVTGKLVSEARKEVVVNCYANYCRWKGLSFKKPGYRRVKTLPFIPLDVQIDA